MEAENLKKLTADQWLNVLGGLIAVEQLLPEMVRDSKQRETLTAALRMGEVAGRVHLAILRGRVRL